MDPVSSAPPSGRSEGRRGPRRWSTPAVALVLAAILGGCSAAATPSSVATPSPVPTTASAAPTASPSPTPAPSFPVTLTDDEGDSITLPAEPQKIVSLTPGTTETVYAVGAGVRLAAVTSFDDYPAQVTSLPQVATYTAIDVEKIVGLGADLVLAGGNGFNPPDQLAKLRSLGIPVLVVYARDVPGVLHDIELVGQAVGRADAARDLTASMQAGFDQIHAAVANLSTPRTFYEIDTTGAIYGPADQSFLTGMITLAGGTPITTGDPNKFDIPLEKLVTADPEVIVLGDAAYGATPKIVEARQGWGTMTAVKTQAIRPVDDIVITRPGPRLVEGLRDLALAIHPEAASLLPAPSPGPSDGGAASPAASASAAP
jgi:iron complex transport system substrate-binding protein